MSKRKAIKEVMDAVERGQAFTVYGRDGEPLAMVIPWKEWQALQRALEMAEREYLPPSGTA
jgi:PHD/YefM family antitoxin component YafN of YafNO toxin-antitoxin module